MVSFYEKNLLLLGDRPEALRWSPQGQLLRYNLFLELSEDLHVKKVLDYGCGKGDFYGFLKDRGISTAYTGIDITPALIELARKKYPECVFRVMDILDDPIDEDFDYVFVCGVFNNKIDGIEEITRSTIKRLFERTRIGLAFNLLSSYAIEKHPELNYADPSDALSFAIEELSPYVSLRHDAVPDDFTLFVYKNPLRSIAQ